MIALLTGNNITRGQWPYRLQSTRAMENSSSNSGDLNSLGGLETSSEVQFDLRFETSNLDYPGINVHIASNNHFIPSEAMAASKRPRRSHLTSELNSVTSTTLVSMCILPLTAILVAYDAVAASKQPQRSQLTSELKSVTSITYVAMLLWPLTASSDSILPGQI